MQITVKLYAGFRQYLPKGAGAQGVTVDVDKKATPQQLLKELHVPEDKIHLVLINGVYIDPQRRDQPIFVDHDVLAVWPAVAGG
jgi:sulfur-carrier protein